MPSNYDTKHTMPSYTVAVLFNTLLGDKGVHAFVTGISPKVIVMAVLQLELFCYEIGAQHIRLLTNFLVL